jgi:hypothetical protein
MHGGTHTDMHRQKRALAWPPSQEMEYEEKLREREARASGQLAALDAQYQVPC